MTEIYVDADACPVKDETVKVASRHGLTVYMVSNGGIRPYHSDMVRIVVVAEGPDAADDWIAENATAGDVVVTNDIPLAARAMDKKALALRPTGDEFSEGSIGMALAMRDLTAGLRETGTITGGPPPFSKTDRSNFLNALEVTVQQALKVGGGS